MGDRVEVARARAGSVAAGLRRMADEVDRRADGFTAESSMLLPNRNSRAASEVVHSVMWGIANLNLDALVDAAGRADLELIDRG